MEAYFHFVDCTNRFLDFMGSFGTRENKMSMAHSLLKQCSAAVGTGNTLDEMLVAVLDSLGPLAANSPVRPLQFPDARFRTPGAIAIEAGV